MGLGGILQRLKTEGVLALYHDYRSGTLKDWSGNGHDGVGSNITFTNSGILQKSTSAPGVIVSSSALLEVTTGCLITRIKKSYINMWPITKKSGVDYQLRLHLDSTHLTMRDSGPAPWPDIPLTSNEEITLGVNYVTGGTPSAWKNGLLSGNLDDTVVIVPNNGDLVIGNDGVGSGTIGNMIYYALWINRPLTAIEHSEIYYELQR